MNSFLKVHSGKKQIPKSARVTYPQPSKLLLIKPKIDTKGPKSPARTQLTSPLCLNKPLPDLSRISPKVDNKGFDINKHSNNKKLNKTEQQKASAINRVSFNDKKLESEQELLEISSDQMKINTFSTVIENRDMLTSSTTKEEKNYETKLIENPKVDKDMFKDPNSNLQVESNIFEAIISESSSHLSRPDL